MIQIILYTLGLFTSLNALVLNTSYRIIGGNIAPTLEPWIMYLEAVQDPTKEGSKVNKCGATLVSKNIFLTAAHCTFTHFKNYY